MIIHWSIHAFFLNIRYDPKCIEWEIIFKLLFILFFSLTDLNWINVHSAAEAWKVLRVGRKNQSFASTHQNLNSSRRCSEMLANYWKYLEQKII